MIRKYSQDKHTKSTRSLQKHPQIIKSIKKCPLSSSIETGLQISQKLSLVRLGITEIDILPMVFYNTIRILYLSDNHIQSLQNIQFFNRLQTLSLSNNNLSQLSTLRYLLPLKQLINLSLDGNSITKCLFYLPYTLGMIDQLKTLDHHLIDDNKKQNQLQNFTMYQEGMSQLIKNYMIMLHIFRIYHKSSIHNIIIEARKQIKIEDQDLYIHEFDIEKYLKATSNYMQEFPSNVLIEIQGQLCRDLQNMTRIQLQQNQNVMQAYFYSICQLQKKQLQKISQLKTKFSNKLSTIQQGKLYQLQLTNTMEIISKIYIREQKSFAQYHFEKKIYRKYFNQLKSNYKNKKHKLVVSVCFVEILDGNLNRVYKSCLEKITKFGLMKIGNNFMKKLEKIVIRQKHYCFKKITGYKLNTQKFLKVLVKQQNIEKLRQYFGKWRQSTKLVILLACNKQQQQIIANMVQKEKRYIKKIQLLQELLKISEDQYKNSLIASPYPKLLSLINQEDLSQNFKSNQPTPTSSCRIKSQKQMLFSSQSSQIIRTEQSQSSRVQLFPSGKRIKNFPYFNSQLKQNRMHIENTKNIEPKGFQQRKLNFSRINRDVCQ